MKKLIGYLTVFFIINCAQVFSKTVYNIGDTGPAGGKIFYIDPANKKMLPPGKTYLEAAPVDQSTHAPWVNEDSIRTDIHEIAIGKGLENTTAIVVENGEGNYAARICYSLELHGYSDWFLPSKDELNLVYENLAKNKADNGGFARDSYWSSSECYFVKTAWLQHFNDGSQIEELKGHGHYTSCIRAF